MALQYALGRFSCDAEKEISRKVNIRRFGENLEIEEDNGTEQVGENKG